MSYLINPFIYSSTGCTGDAISTTNLQLYYQFNSSLNDSSGNARNLSFSGSSPQYRTGKFSNGIDMSGNTVFPYLQNLTYNFQGVTDMSWGAWVNFDALPSISVIASKLSTTTNGGFGIGQYQTPSTWYAYFFAQAAYVEIGTTSNAPSASTWFHVAATRNATTGEFFLYVDGAYKTSGSTGTNSMLSAGTQPMTVGCQYVASSPARFTDGIIDELFVYHRTLTPSEILDLYSSTCPLKS